MDVYKIMACPSCIAAIRGCYQAGHVVCFLIFIRHQHGLLHATEVLIEHCIPI